MLHSWREREVRLMINKILAMVLGLSFVALMAVVPGAEAKGRLCPKGSEDIGGVCVPTPPQVPASN